MIKDFFINTGSRNIYCLMEFPENFKNGCPIVVLMHGILVDCRAYPFDILSEFFLSLGFAVVRFDFNGHGRSDGEFVDMTVPREIDDAKAVFEYLKMSFDESKIVVLGHSQGGTVACMVSGICNDLVDLLILLAPGAVLEDACNQGRVVDAVFDPDNIPDRLFAMKNVFGGEYFRTGRNLHIYQVASGFKGPVCIIHGQYDTLVPVEYSFKFGEFYEDCEISVIKNADHWFYRGLNEVIDIIRRFLVCNKKDL